MVRFMCKWNFVKNAIISKPDCKTIILIRHQISRSRHVHFFCYKIEPCTRAAVVLSETILNKKVKESGFEEL